jgi:hypothetical protein
MEPDLATLNVPLIYRLMATTGPVGAYCLGALSVLAIQTGRHFEDSVYERAARCNTLSEVDELVQTVSVDTPESARKGQAVRQFLNLFAKPYRAG